jgi:hypothetical protein
MAAQQVRGGKQSAAGADVQFSLAGEETVNIPLLYYNKAAKAAMQMQ